MLISTARCHFSSIAKKNINSGILMMNLGGPSSLEEVQPFLTRLFQDKDMMNLPMQQFTASLIARRRSPRIREQYNAIGGGSPIKIWTEKQGALLEKLLDQRHPTISHKTYIAFRYSSPMTEDALIRMRDDGVESLTIFSQYPQYSCATTGSSLNELQRQLQRLDMRFKHLRIIDRWPTHPTYIQAIAKKIQTALLKFPASSRQDVVILFSAHSLPQYVNDRGDTYTQEISASVQAVMDSLHHSHPYRLVWQSKVGPLPWLKPHTMNAIKSLIKEKNVKNILLVPIAFTSDHIETLYELDQEYIPESLKLGADHVIRAESLNDDPLFIKALADIYDDHRDHSASASCQMLSRCPHCVNHHCIDMRNYFSQACR